MTNINLILPIILAILIGLVLPPVHAITPEEQDNMAKQADMEIAKIQADMCKNGCLGPGGGTSAASASESNSASGSTSSATNTNNINIINQIPPQKILVQPRPDVKILSPTINLAPQPAKIIKPHTATATVFCNDVDPKSSKHDRNYQDGYDLGQHDWKSPTFQTDLNGHTKEFQRGYNAGWTDAKNGINRQPC